MKWSLQSKLTIRREQIGDIGLSQSVLQPGISKITHPVSSLASPEIDSRRTADSNCAVVPIIQRSFVYDVLVEEWHVIQ